MAVRVPISADASAVTVGLEAMREALRRAGQEAKALQDIDLSHPELADVAADIVRVRENIESLQKVARGATATNARAIIAGGDGSLFGPRGLFADTNRNFTELSDAIRFRENAGRYVLDGTTSFKPRRQPEDDSPYLNRGVRRGGGGGGGEAAEEGAAAGAGKFGNPLASLGGGAMGALAGGGAFLLAAAGLGAVKDVLSKSLDQAGQEASQTDLFMRNIHSVNESFADLRDGIMATAKSVNVTDAQMQQFALSVARTTNEHSADRALATAAMGSDLARGYGTDRASIVDALARGQVAGMQPRDFAILIGETVAESGATGQVAETTQALLRWSENAARLMLNPANITGYASVMAGMYASGNPGLRGANGEALIDRIDATIRQGGGGGMAGQVLEYQAFQRQGITDPYQIRYQEQGGAFEKLPGSNMTNFEAVSQELDRQLKGMSRYQRLDALGNFWGIQERQAEAMQNGFTQARSGQGRAQLSSYGLDPDKVNVSAFSEIFDLINKKSDPEDVRKRMLERGNYLTEYETSKIKGDSGQALVQDLVQALAAHGMTTTPGSEHEDAQAKLTNELTQVGRDILPLTDAVSKLTGTLIEEIEPLLKMLAGVEDHALNGPSNRATGPRPELLSMPPSTVTPDGHFIGGSSDFNSNAPAAQMSREASLDLFGKIESGGGKNMTNPNSSAMGLFGYERRTWLEDIRRAAAANPEIAARIRGLSDDQIAALRMDSDLQRKVMGWALENRIDPSLRRNGDPVNPETEHLAIHFGDGGVHALLHSAPDRSMREAIGEEAYNANPDTQGRTVRSYLREHAQRFPRAAPIIPATALPPYGGTPLPPEAERRSTADQQVLRGELTVRHVGPNGQQVRPPETATLTAATPPPKPAGMAHADPPPISPGPRVAAFSPGY